MIDVIFDLIMKEARRRPGDNILDKIQAVLLAVDMKVMSAMENIIEDARREKINENERSNHRSA